MKGRFMTGVRVDLKGLEEFGSSLAEEMKGT